MRVRPSFFVLAALAVATATGCGSSSDSEKDATTADTPAQTTAATTPDGKPATSPVSVLGSSVDVKAGQVDVSLRLRQPSDADPPIADTAQITLPRASSGRAGTRHRATRTRSRAASTPARPVRSSAPARPSDLTDQAETIGEITAVSGGKDEVGLATLVRHPAYVKTVVPGKISEDDGHLKLDLTFPPALQTIAGVPVGLQSLKLTVKRGPWLQVPDCPDDGWDYDARVTFDDGTQVEHEGKATCSG